MKFTFHKSLNLEQWHRWFAWHPVKLEVDPGEDSTWVWLETIEQRRQPGWPYGYTWRYRNKIWRESDLVYETQYH